MVRKLRLLAIVRYANDGTSLITTNKLMPRLWISPQKYWVTMTFDTPSTISRS